MSFTIARRFENNVQAAVREIADGILAGGNHPSATGEFLNVAKK